MKKTALITGIAGQDGAYLCAFLVRKGYQVHGLVRWDSHLGPLDGLQRLDKLGLVSDLVKLHMGDITDANAVTKLIRDVKPDEIYNLAAMSQVGVSFGTPSSTLDINAKGTLNILDALRVLEMERDVRVYQASSSEMFGSAPAPQNETTPMQPCSPYGVSKLAGFHLAKIYRESYKMHISNGILFNHESPFRGEDFVTRKITKAVAMIEAGEQDVLELGNLSSIRDWGYSRDYIEGMWKMLQHPFGDDYVLATGEARSVRDFTRAAFAQIGIDLVFVGKGANEQGIDRKTSKILVKVDPALYRPNEVNHLLGDASKARKVLNWQPKINFEQLVEIMVNADRTTVANILNGKTEQKNAPWRLAG
ncbi:MAG: GDP-mannose 4,6-dehydratase [Alphaproteobacteria bacterium]